MKIQSALLKTSLGMIMGMVLTLKTEATVINIPCGNFQGIVTNMNMPTLLSSTNNKFGAWSAQIGGAAGLNCSMGAGLAANLGGPTPPNATYDVAVSLPTVVGVTATLSQTLTNCWLPDSTYTFSVDLAQSGSVNVLSSTTLSLQGGTNSASMPGTTLVSLLTGATGFKTATLVFKTGNSAPTNPITISLTMPSVVGASGHIYVSNFQLSEVPTQIQLAMKTTPGNKSNITFTGTGGAPGAQYQIVTYTNLAVGVTNWAMMVSGQFDASGNFSQVIAVDVNTHHRFFRTYLP